MKIFFAKCTMFSLIIINKIKETYIVKETSVVKVTYMGCVMISLLSSDSQARNINNSDNGINGKRFFSKP